MVRSQRRRAEEAVRPPLQGRLPTTGKPDPGRQSRRSIEGGPVLLEAARQTAEELENWRQYFDLEEADLGILIHPQYNQTDPETREPLPADQEHWETGIHARSLEELDRYQESRLRFDTYIRSSNGLNPDTYITTIYQATVEGLENRFPEAEHYAWNP